MRRLAITLTILLIASRPIAAQQGGELLSNTRAARTALIEAPKPKETHAFRNMFLANAVMFGSSLVEANAVAYGSKQCRAENLFDHHSLQYFGNLGGGQRHPYQHAFKITIPLDIGVATLSYMMHKKHHDTAAITFPISSASAQFSPAGLKYGAGCF